MDIIYQEFIHSRKVESIFIKYNNGYTINKGLDTKQIIFIKISGQELTPVQIVDGNHNITAEGNANGFFILNGVIHKYYTDHKLDKTAKFKLINDNIKPVGDTFYSNIINLFFDKIYVINLKKDTLKRDIFIHNNKEHNLKFDFIEGVDGNNDDHCNILLQSYLSNPLKYNGCSKQELYYNTKMLKNRSQIGYLKSMLNVFKDALSKSYEYIIIFDDDVLLSNDFCKTLYYKLRLMPPKWEIVRLGSNWHTINNHQDHIINKPLYKTLPCDGSYAIAYNKNVFQFMIDKIQFYNITFDTGPLRDYNKHDYTIYPFIAIADVFTSSMHDSTTDITSYSNERNWDLSLYTFKSSLRKISVIIITLNNSTTIVNSVQSILNQVYTNIEIIIVDNNSTDDTFKKITRIQQHRSNIRTFRLKRTLSHYRIKNDIIKQCNGHYITYHDPTSYALPYKLVTQINDIIRYGYKIIYTSVITAIMNLGQIEDISKIEFILQTQLNNVKQPTIGYNTMLIDKTLLTKYGYYKSDNELEYIFDMYKQKYNKSNLTTTEFFNVLTKKDHNLLIYYNRQPLSVIERSIAI